MKPMTLSMLAFGGVRSLTNNRRKASPTVILNKACHRVCQLEVLGIVRFHTERDARNRGFRAAKRHAFSACRVLCIVFKSDHDRSCSRFGSWSGLQRTTKDEMTYQRPAEIGRANHRSGISTAALRFVLQDCPIYGEFAAPRMIKASLRLPCQWRRK